MTSGSRNKIIRTLTSAHSDVEDAALSLSEGQTENAAESIRKAYQQIRRLMRHLGPVLKEKRKAKR